MPQISLCPLTQRYIIRLCRSKAQCKTPTRHNPQPFNLHPFSTEACSYQPDGIKPPLLSACSHQLTSITLRTSKPFHRRSLPRSLAPPGSLLYSTDTNTPQAPSQKPLKLSVERYHDLADCYIDLLLVELEKLQEDREDVDCEYSVRSFYLPHKTDDLTTFPGAKTGWCSHPHNPPARHLRTEQTAP